MSVKPGSLKNPERDQTLETREPAPPPPSARPDEKKDATAAALRDKLARARDLKPYGPHWLECWCRGRDAAVATIEADGNTARARTIPAPAVIGCADCFRKGRDAVVKLVDAP